MQERLDLNHSAAWSANGDLLLADALEGEESGLPQQMAREMTLLKPASQFWQQEVDAQKSVSFSNGRSKNSMTPETRIATPAT